jgi:uncharacterized protein
MAEVAGARIWAPAVKEKAGGEGGGVPVNDTHTSFTTFVAESKCFAYDMNTGVIIKIDHGLYDLLTSRGIRPEWEGSACSGRADGHQSDAEDRLQQLQTKLGLLRPITAVSRLAHPDTVSAHFDQLVRQFNHLTLNVTDRCNLRCAYCAYSGGYVGTRQHGDLIMTWETALAAIEYFLANSTPARLRYVSFYGGEPFLAHELVLRCIEYVSKRAPDVSFGATTNGTVLAPSLCEYLASWKVRLLISLDGDQFHHDRYRVMASGDGSFSRVWDNIECLHDRYGEYYAQRVSVSAVMSSVGDYAPAIRFFLEHPDLFGPSRVRFSRVVPGHTGFDWSRPTDEERESFERLERQFIERTVQGDGEDDELLYLRNAFQGPYSDIHSGAGELAGLIDGCHLTSSCFPGDTRLFVRADGTFLICEKSTDALEIGDVFRGIDRDRIMGLYRSFWALYGRACLGCWAMRYCSTCFLTATTATGKFDQSLREERCESVRRFWKRKLEVYCSIIERNPHAFDYLVGSGLIREANATTNFLRSLVLQGDYCASEGGEGHG